MPLTIRKITDEEKEGWMLAVSTLRLTGHHFADELYEHYARVMRENKREPVHPIRLGQILAEFGALHRPKWRRGRYKDRNGNYRPGQMRKGWVL